MAWISGRMQKSDVQNDKSLCHFGCHLSWLTICRMYNETRESPLTNLSLKIVTVFTFVFVITNSGPSLKVSTLTLCHLSQSCDCHLSCTFLLVILSVTHVISKAHVLGFRGAHDESHNITDTKIEHKTKSEGEANVCQLGAEPHRCQWCPDPTRAETTATAQLQKLPAEPNIELQTLNLDSLSLDSLSRCCSMRGDSLLPPLTRISPSAKPQSKSSSLASIWRSFWSFHGRFTKIHSRASSLTILGPLAVMRRIRFWSSGESTFCLLHLLFSLS